MSLVVLQACNCEVRGWARRSFFVFFSYAFRAASKMDWKLEGHAGLGFEDDARKGAL